MFQGCRLGVGENRQAIDDHRELGLTLWPMSPCRTLNTMPEFCDGNSGDLGNVFSLALQPGWEIKPGRSPAIMTSASMIKAIVRVIRSLSPLVDRRLQDPAGGAQIALPGSRSGE